MSRYGIQALSLLFKECHELAEQIFIYLYTYSRGKAKVATWADPSIDRLQSLRILKGSLPLDPDDLDKHARISEDKKIQFNQIEGHPLNTNDDNIPKRRRETDN